MLSVWRAQCAADPIADVVALSGKEGVREECLVTCADFPASVHARIIDYLEFNGNYRLNQPKSDEVVEIGRKQAAVSCADRKLQV